MNRIPRVFVAGGKGSLAVDSSKPGSVSEMFLEPQDGVEEAVGLSLDSGQRVTVLWEPQQPEHRHKERKTWFKAGLKQQQTWTKTTTKLCIHFKMISNKINMILIQSLVYLFHFGNNKL